MLDKEGNLCDNTIEKTFKGLLVIPRFGLHLKNIVSHYEYFMNTLEVPHKRNTINPFDIENAKQFPALHFKGNVSSHDSLLERASEEDMDLIDNDELNKTPDKR